VAVGLLVWWGLGLLAAALLRGRLSVARDLALSAALAGVLSYLVAQAVHAGWPPGSDWHFYGPPAWYPAVQLAVPAAAVITASPHLTRPARRLGRWLVAGAALGVVALSATTILGASAGIVAAIIAAGLVHLAFGSSAGRPSLHGVGQALAELGVATSALGKAQRQEAGLFTVEALDADGAPIVVRVYGRDAHDTALVSALWRAVWLRQPGAQLRLSRLAQVEHEALLTLLADQAGIPTDQVVVAGATADDDALLVVRRSGTTLSDCAEAVDADRLARGGGCWPSCTPRVSATARSMLATSSSRPAGWASPGSEAARSLPPPASDAPTRRSTWPPPPCWPVRTRRSTSPSTRSGPAGSRPCCPTCSRRH
jgi:glycosyltransferase 2 family protein